MWDKDERTYVSLTYDVLDVGAISQLVSVPEAGAVSVFVGTTRNNFQGKSVFKLEYEGYTPMAMECMRVRHSSFFSNAFLVLPAMTSRGLQAICSQACEKWGICKAAAVHRMGTVNVQEASIVIATSSAHRAAAMEACQWVIDEVKAAVPVWKKEFFEDGSVWKENSESRMRAQASLQS